MAGKPVAHRFTQGNAMTTQRSMFLKSVLALTLAAAATGAHALSFARLFHTHPSIRAAQRFNTTLTNPNLNFRGIQVGGRVYTVPPHHGLVVTAPAGTPIYAADNMSHRHAKGSLLAQVAPKDQTLALE